MDFQIDSHWVPHEYQSAHLLNGGAVSLREIFTQVWVDRPKRVPLTGRALQFWLGSRSGAFPAHVDSQTHFFVRLQRAVKKEHVERTLRDVAQRHKLLRSSIVELDLGPHYEFDRFDVIPLETASVSIDAERQAAQIVKKFARSGFRFSNGHSDPLCRALLVKITDSEYIFGVVLHHVICDFSGLLAIRADVIDTYLKYASGDHTAESRDSIQYVDFMKNMDDWLDSEAGSWVRDYWMRKLECAPKFMLPMDARDESSGKNYSENIVRYSVPKEFVSRIAEFLKTQHIFAGALFSASYAAIIMQKSKIEDSLIRLKHSGRDDPITESIMGYFVVSLPLRFKISRSDTFLSLINTVMNEYVGYLETPKIFLEKILSDDVISECPSLNFTYVNRALQRHDNVISGLSDYPVLPPDDAPLAIQATSTKNLYRVSTSYKITYVEGASINGVLTYPGEMYTKDSISQFVEMVWRFVDEGIRTPLSSVDEILERVISQKRSCISII